MVWLSVDEWETGVVAEQYRCCCLVLGVGGQRDVRCGVIQAIWAVEGGGHCKDCCVAWGSQERWRAGGLWADVQHMLLQTSFVAASCVACMRHSAGRLKTYSWS
jgi:hypothetical protein